MRKSYRDAILAEANAAKAIMDGAAREERELSDVEQDKIGEHLGKAAKFEADGLAEEAFKKQMADLSKNLGLTAPGSDPLNAADVHPAGTPQAKERKTTVGKRFTESDAFKQMLGSVPNGSFSEKMRVQSQPVSFGGMKDLFYSGNREESAGFLVESDNRGMLDPFYERPLSIRALFQGGNTTSDTIEYVRLVTVDNNASVVPEARSTAPIGDGTGGTTTAALGGLKPESTFGFERDSTTVKTIAHWIPVTKRALADAAQIRTMIDSFLRYGLEESFENELLSGDGTGEHLLGLNNTPGIQTQAAPSGDLNNLDVLRIARRKVQIGGRATPTAYVMNPIDWEGVELMKNGNGDYRGAGPFALTAPRLWGLPVLQSEAVPAGTAWCAAWNWGVVYDREQATVQATDTHADFFVRNLVAILAEMRAGFAILRPPAFVKVTLGA
jgi:HK97 family phage major capsid protein